MANQIFRPATTEDIETMHAIALRAKVYLKNCGVNQWQVGDYPSAEIFENDILNQQSYILEEGNHIIAMTAIIPGQDPSYADIDGQWLTTTNDFYATIHRCAISDHYRGKHIVDRLFCEAEKIACSHNAKSLRIDTHPDNQAMQKALARAKFSRCGIIRLRTGAEIGAIRIAFEKRL